MNTFADNLRKRISDLGLTQAEAARRCDLENRRFHHYIVGDREPDLRTLVRIATVLGTTSDELLGAKPTKDEPTDEVCRLRAKLIATVGIMDQPALRLMSVFADGVIAFIREGTVADETGTRTDHRPAKRRQ
jgi:transcriptional regulator with XRE-family HTH domain